MPNFCFCGSLAVARDLCRKHYNTAHKAGLSLLLANKRSKPLGERLLEKVEKSGDGCWIFTGTRDKSGYGSIWLEGRHVIAHRASFSIFCSPIKKGDVICHKCDVRACINPEHLFKGTRLDNNRDKVAKGRQFKGETHPGSKLTEDDVSRILAITGMTTSGIARMFSVNPSTIHRIRSGERWKHRVGDIM